MPNNNSNGVGWADPVWQEINDAVVKEMAKVRIGQKVFPTSTFDTAPTEIPDEVIDFKDLSIKEGQTKALVEIYREFPLTATQVDKEPQMKTCKTLARMAAKEIALTEDSIIFQGNDFKLPAGLKADQQDSTKKGLLGEAKEKIDVKKLAKPKPGVVYGENVFAEVAKGIAKLTEKAQAPKYALFLPTRVYADTFVPPSDASLVTTAERIKPLVEGGFYGTGTLPDDKEIKGLLVALGGDPTSLHVGREATTEYVRKEGAKYFFRVVERIQFVARDSRSLILLNFEP
jgi:uncharacterized linocin/CFP29 family protein